MQIAKRVYLLAQEQNEPAPMIGGCAALAITHYFSGNFEASGQCAIRGVQIWRSGGVQSSVEEVDVPGVACLCYEALFKWHIGEIASSKVTIEETISVERELNDMHGLAVALHFASILAYFERKSCRSGTLGIGCDRTFNASEFRVLVGCGSHPPRLGTQRFGRHGSRHRVDRERNRRLSGDRLDDMHAILFSTKG